MNVIAPTRPSASAGTLAVQLGYSAANMGKSVVWTSFESIMLFYLVSVAGFAPLAAGALLAVALLWDATFDLIVARWTDRRGEASGLGTLMLIGAPLCGVGFWLIFALRAPSAVAAAIVACRIGYSLCDVGHNTLLIRVARAPGDASRVSGLRLLFSAAGVALLALASGSSLSLAGAEAQRASFASGAMVGGALYIATLFGAMRATRNLPPPVAQGAGGAVRPLLSYWRSPPFRRLLFVIAVQAGMVPLFLRALPFFGAAVHGDAGWAGPALLTITLAQSLAIPGWMMASRHCASRTIAIIASGATIVAMVVLTIGSGGVADTVTLALLGAALGGMNLAIWTLLTETVRESLTGGASGEATPVGLFLAVLKGAAALGNLSFAGVVAAGPVQVFPHVALLPTAATVVPIIGAVVALGLLSVRRDRCVA